MLQSGGMALGFEPEAVPQRHGENADRMESPKTEAPSRGVTPSELVPLVVDLDGTLLRTDTLAEGLLALMKANPVALAGVLLSLITGGRAGMKRRLAEALSPEVSRLPEREGLLAYIRAERAKGRRVLLVTAADQRVAEAVAARFRCFDGAIGSSGGVNLKAGKKAARLVELFGERGFDYAGNSGADVAVWKRARRALVCGGARGLRAKAEAACGVEAVFEEELPPGGRVRLWARTLRAHQWSKNVLLIVAFLGAHAWDRPLAWAALGLAVAGFCLCASSGYILNDLLDIDADRSHPRKRNRPFAHGDVPLWAGMLAVPVLAGLAGAVCVLLPPPFAVCLGVYYVATVAYSCGLKRVALLDVLMLAGLYTVRIVAGGLAVDVPLSFWLLAFSMFAFVSMGFVKRYAELADGLKANRLDIAGRGYRADDAGLVAHMGAASGYVATLVLAFYLHSEEVRLLYQRPEALWGASVVFLFWISRLWLKTHRGEMHDDPVVFALRDRVSHLCGLLLLAILFLAQPKPL